MKKSGELNGHGDPKGEKGKVVIGVVKHTKRGIDLRGQLSNVTGEKDHGKSSLKEDSLKPCWETPDLGTSNGTSRDIDAEHNEYHHELTSEEVSVEVISLIGDLGTLVSLGVRVGVKLGIDRDESDERGLSSLNHGEPDDGCPKKTVGGSWVGILRKVGLLGSDHSTDEDDRENQQNDRVDTLDKFEWIHFDIYCGVV
mmetsp:Transcript_1925/g.2777  ORF Transcript_1925/g.2777 Transcript_1925/m.2777 type:complete len:198 (-) Transcript_1925:126-719(-)